MNHIGVPQARELWLFGTWAVTLKGYNSSDPYPGYSKVSQDVIDARDDYIGYLEDSIDSLAEHRDEAVSSLRMANDEVHRNINDSVDALYGQKALQSNLMPFLEQCNITANYLLSVYRDANKATRKDKAPEYFDKEYIFQPFTAADADTSRRDIAESQVKEVSDMVNEAITEIFKVFHEAVKSHYEIDELEGTHIERSTNHITEKIKPTEDLKLDVVSNEQGIT